MLGIRGVLLIAGMVVLLLVGAGFASAEPATPYVPDQVLVKFRPGTPASDIARAHASIHAAIRDEIPQIGVQIVGLPRGLSVGKAIGFYQRNPNVEFVEPDYYVEAALTPNDPCFHYGQIALQRTGAEQAWDITIGDPSVTIAVLDSGADLSNADLEGRLVAGWDFVDNDGDPTDTNGHGTEVTGVLGAATNNGAGIAGVSWCNPVLVARIGGYDGCTTWGRMAEGIAYAADHGARAINLSFAGPGSYPTSTASAVDYAWSKGAVTIAAAGNSSSSDPYYPAALAHVVAVGALDDNDVHWYGSNYGLWIDVVAPGGSVTTNIGGAFRCWGGTSMSAPFVTGLFGLVFSVNPGLTPQQAVNIVEQTADDLGDPGFDIYYGYGKINMYQAVLAASQTVGAGGDTTPPQVDIAAPAPATVVNGTTEVSADASDSVGVDLVELYLDEQLVGSLTSAPYSWSWDTTQEPNGSHVIKARARDRAGNTADSAPVTVMVNNTTADPTPVTETFTGSVGFSRRATSQTYGVSVSAPGSVTASLTWGGKADLNFYAFSPSGTRVAASATKAAPEALSFQATETGTYQFQVVAASGKASYTLTVTYP